MLESRAGWVGPAELENAHVASPSSQLLTSRNVDAVLPDLLIFFQEKLEIRIFK